MIQLYQIGEPLVAAMLEKLIETNRGIPAWTRKAKKTVRADLRSEIQLKKAIQGGTYRSIGSSAKSGLNEGRLIINGKKLDPMHAVDISLITKGAKVFPIEVKFGKTIYSDSSFFANLVGKKPYFESSDKITGSVCSILEAHANDTIHGKVSAKIHGDDYPLEKNWGLAIIRDQFVKISQPKLEWPKGLEFVLVYEELRDALGEEFEEVTFALWPPKGSASKYF
jgi:hypothetical protein